MSKKKTVIIGASDNPARYAYIAAGMLNEYRHPFVPLGLRKGMVFGKKIENEKLPIEEVDTVTLYVGPANQPFWADYILSLNPRRIIFNPGTENPELEQNARGLGIEVIEACTLVMLRTGQF